MGPRNNSLSNNEDKVITVPVPDAVSSIDEKGAASIEPAVPETVSSIGKSNKKKRKPKIQAEDKEDIVFVKKRCKREIDFELHQIESNLAEALGYAKDGNKELMEFCLDEVKKSAKSSGSLDANLTRRLQQIRSQFGSQRGFHSRQAEAMFQEALVYAKDGNKDLMEHCLTEAINHARSGGFFITPFTREANQIRRKLSSQRNFHLRQVEMNFGDALRYAKDGDKSLMEHCLKEAMDHAKSCGSYDTTFTRRTQSIRRQLSSQRGFHLREVEAKLGEAFHFAKEGDKSLMEFCLEEAMDHVRSSGSRITEFKARAQDIRNYFTGGGLKNMVKAEVKLEQKGNKRTCKVKRASNQNTANVISNEVQIKKEMSSAEIIRNNLAIAQSTGKIVDLS